MQRFQGNMEKARTHPQGVCTVVSRNLIIVTPPYSHAIDIRGITYVAFEDKCGFYNLLGALKT